MCLVLSDEMIDLKLIIIFVLCANCVVSGITINSNDKGECCVPEEDLEASATFNFPSNEIPLAYNIYDPSLRNTPSILDPRLNRFGGLGHPGLPVHVQTFGKSPKNNVEIITTYTNEKKTGPIYKQSTITRKNLDDVIEKKKTGKKGRYNPEKGPVSYTNVNIPTKNKQYTKNEYEAEKTKHPEENKSLYEETKSEGSESSSFNRGIRYKNSYKEPPTSIIEKLNEDGGNSGTIHTSGGGVDSKFHPRLSSGIESTNLESKPKILEKISDQPLQEAGSIGKSFISGDLDSGSLGFIGGGSLLGDSFGYDKEKHFEKEKGKHYAEAHKKEEGHKSEKDFKVKEAFDKGEEEKHGSHHHKGSGHEQGGEKKGHLDEAKKYKEGHEASKGEKASDFLHKKGHRKGHKKSGFHTVHHKDEFKKDEHFFDEEHDTGEEAAHGHSDHKHAHKHGGEQKEGHHDSGYKEAHHKKQGDKEEGHSHHQHAGHKAEQGHQSHHAQAAEHASKEGHKEAEKHGHSEKHEEHLL